MFSGGRNITLVKHFYLFDPSCPVYLLFPSAHPSPLPSLPFFYSLLLDPVHTSYISPFAGSVRGPLTGLFDSRDISHTYILHFRAFSLHFCHNNSNSYNDSCHARCTSGAVWGSVSCPRTLWHADQGNQTSNLLIRRCWLYPTSTAATYRLTPFGQKQTKCCFWARYSVGFKIGATCKHLWIG